MSKKAARKRRGKSVPRRKSVRRPPRRRRASTKKAAPKRRLIAKKYGKRKKLKKLHPRKKRVFRRVKNDRVIFRDILGRHVEFNRERPLTAFFQRKVKGKWKTVAKIMRRIWKGKGRPTPASFKKAHLHPSVAKAWKPVLRALMKKYALSDVPQLFRAPLGRSISETTGLIYSDKRDLRQTFKLWRVWMVVRAWYKVLKPGEDIDSATEEQNVVIVPYKVRVWGSPAQFAAYLREHRSNVEYLLRQAKKDLTILRILGFEGLQKPRKGERPERADIYLEWGGE